MGGSNIFTQAVLASFRKVEVDVSLLRDPHKTLHSFCGVERAMMISFRRICVISREVQVSSLFLIRGILVYVPMLGVERFNVLRI